MKRWLIIGGAALVAVLLVVVFAKGFGTDPHAVPFGLLGKPAPAFKMTRLDTGEEVSLSSFAGKPVVLNFWATWCGPCKMEHPTLQWAYETYRDRVVFIGIVFEDTEENTKKFLKQNGEAFPQLFDRKSTVAVDYAVTGVPETYFINRQGIIVSKYAAPIDARTFQQYVAEIL